MALFLLQQQPMATGTLALRLGIKTESCRQMLCRLSRRLPVYYDYEMRVWVYSSS